MAEVMLARHGASEASSRGVGGGHARLTRAALEQAMRRLGRWCESPAW
jgi:hypothetical protein